MTDQPAFKIGDRVRMTEAGRNSFPSKANKLGTVKMAGHNDYNGMRVLIDGQKQATGWAYIFWEKIND